jgi:hypothetical protein
MSGAAGRTDFEGQRFFELVIVEPGHQSVDHTERVLQIGIQQHD